jgi:hypothetical protein
MPSTKAAIVRPPNKQPPDQSQSHRPLTEPIPLAPALHDYCQDEQNNPGQNRADKDHQGRFPKPRSRPPLRLLRLRPSRKLPLRQQGTANHTPPRRLRALLAT